MLKSLIAQCSPKNKSKNETRIEATTFTLSYFMKLLFPPTFSLERCEKYCKLRIQKNPYAYFPRTSLAELYKYHKKNEDAKEQYEEIILLGEMRDIDWISLAEVLFRLEDYSSVTKTLSPIIENYPHHEIANWLLGMSYIKAKDYKSAVIYLERMTAGGSKRYGDYWHLGYCYYQIDNLKKAEINYKKALLLKPDSLELKESIKSINNGL